MIYMIPDTHLGHETIKRYCDRPDNFEDLIERNWNSVVTDDDTVIHLGDVSFKEEWIERVGSWKGRKVLVRGNHDKLPMNIYMKNGFTIVVEDLIMDIDKLVILFSHRPRFSHNCDINIHGHQHNLAVYDNTRLYLPLSIEHMGYKPMALNEQLISKLRQFVNTKRQPTLEEIMTVLSQNAIGKPYDRDYYDGFGKEKFNEFKTRLIECYELLGKEPYSRSMYQYRIWRYAIRYIEGKVHKNDFISYINRLVNF